MGVSYTAPSTECCFARALNLSKYSEFDTYLSCVKLSIAFCAAMIALVSCLVVSNSSICPWSYWAGRCCLEPVSCSPVAVTYLGRDRGRFKLILLNSRLKSRRQHIINWFHSHGLACYEFLLQDSLDVGIIVITVVTALFVNDTGCHFLCEGVTLNGEKLQHLVAPS